MPAMRSLRVVESLDEAITGFRQTQPVELWTTSARERADTLSFSDARVRLTECRSDVMLVFGTGWGLAPEVEERASTHLEPIRSSRADGYNHLSVRAAAAIVFDRLLGVSSVGQP